MSKYTPTTHRNIHTGTVSYGNPANWTAPNEWEPVHVLSDDELRAVQAEAWDEGYQSGVHDERIAAGWDYPATPGRVNPYEEKS